VEKNLPYREAKVRILFVFFFFEAESYCVTQADLEFTILLPRLSSVEITGMYYTPGFISIIINWPNSLFTIIIATMYLIVLCAHVLCMHLSVLAYVK
jgi:hypothetical protein